METQYQVKCSHEQKELIRKASKTQGLGLASFTRMAVLRLSKKILEESQ